MTTLHSRKSIDRSPLRRGFPVLLLALALAFFVPSRTAQAADGGLPNRNTAEGDGALQSLTFGFNNTATGFDALFVNTFGGSNTATGAGTLFSNTIGTNNTATGDGALNANITGNTNTATGAFTLQMNTSGSFNTANGATALELNTTGFNNTATGVFALLSNRTGHDNTAIGMDGLRNNTGSFNIGLGNLAGRNLTTGSNNIDIGNQGVAGENKTIRIGEQGRHERTFIAGIFGATVINGVQVMVNLNGKLGTVASSQRFKDDIKPMDKASEAILALKPVTFHYKKEVDPDGIPQFGLVAEQVEKINPELVVRDKNGEIYTVRYEAVNAMLLNEFLKQHRKVVEQEKIIAQQRKDFQATINKLEATIAQQQKDAQSTAAQQQNEIKTLAADLKEQTALIQKVSDKVELNRPAPQTVVNNQ